MLRLENIVAGYDAARVLDDLSLAVETGELCAVVGPSGCGKTTLLRLIAGFEEPLAGTLSIGGRVMADRDNQVPPEQRGVGIVFQDHVLFPHLDVAANITFGLHRWSADARRLRRAELVEAVALQGLEKRYPHELSGGQQQRVALARALAPNPSLLLLDEPFASLDQRMRAALAAEVRQVLRAAGTTAILVTHDIEEAFAFADRVGVMLGGRLAQWGTPTELYQRPVHRAVAEFVGRGTFLRARVSACGSLATDLGLIGGAERCGAAVGDYVEVFLRPEHLEMGRPGDQHATVRGRRFQGGSILYSLATETIEALLCRFPATALHEPGEKVWIRLAVRQPVVFPLPAGA